jgi:two-component system, OmpR family, sensor kinase
MLRARALGRLSIRIRLTVLFSAVMAVVLLAMGGFVYERVGSSLSASLNNDLRVRADDVSTLRNGTRGDAHDFGGAEGVAQLLASSGAVLRGTPALAGRSLLSPAELTAARLGAVFIDRPVPPAFGDGRWRVLAEPVSDRPNAEIAVVAASLRPREEALHHLLAQLLLAGFAGLGLASGAGYALAAAALRPVEEMSRRAAAISLQGGAKRLPVPETGDEIAKLGTRLNEMLARMETAFAHERRFLADASHELRTPLAILRAELEIALRRPRSREELEDVVRSAQEEANRLGQLAEDLLVVARSDQGALPVSLATIRADDLLASVSERFARRALDAGRSIAIESLDLELRCDPIRIGQALGNLIDNSLRYGAGDITLTARKRVSVIELHVRDDGGGFPAAFLPRAFERFSRADHSRSGPGSGLGLAIVQAIARAHGGDANVANRAGGGSDVWLALPRASA